MNDMWKVFAFTPFAFGTVFVWLMFIRCSFVSDLFTNTMINQQVAPFLFGYGLGAVGMSVLTAFVAWMLFGEGHM